MRRKPASSGPSAELARQVAADQSDTAAGPPRPRRTTSRASPCCNRASSTRPKVASVEALRLDPKLAAAWNGMARIHAERGDLDQSCQASRNAIASRPRQAEAYWRLATTLKGRLPDDEFQAMQDLIQDESLSIDDRALLGFRAGCGHGAAGPFRRGRPAAYSGQRPSFGGKGRARADMRSGCPLDLIDRIIATFTAEFLAPRRGWGIADPRPVFIVGLPRSGTTLTEQIIASHPLVHGAGELADVRRIFSSIPELVGQPSLDGFAAVAALDRDSAHAAAKALPRPPGQPRAHERGPRGR